MLDRKGCSNPRRRQISSIGIQLYSVRDVFEADPEGTIRQLAGMGFKEIESYERNNDMFWGMTNKRFSVLANDLGMSLVSSHCEVEKDFEKKAELAAGIGMKYLVFNWPFSRQPLDEYRKKADLFNRCGEICKKAGLRFAYHNYSSSYQIVEGVFPQDLLMDRTDASLVFHQMDIFWVARAGQDPAEWLAKYPKRFTLCHIKDGNDKETTLLGTGNVALKKALTMAIDNGMDHFFVEQEDYRQINSMEAAGRNFQWVNALKL
jgi:sugar phosphate isomerase/epimerase